MDHIQQIELQLISCRIHFNSKCRDKFLLEIARLQVWAEIYPELKENSEFKFLESVLDSMLIGQEYKDKQIKELGDILTTSSFEELCEYLSEKGWEMDSDSLEKVSRVFQSVFVWKE